MEQLPAEVIFNILLNLHVKSLLEACKTNSVYFNICKSDYFWRQKIALDFRLRNIEYEESPYEFYMKLSTDEIKIVPVYYGSRLLGKVWLTKDKNGQEITQEINNLFVNWYPTNRRYKNIYLGQTNGKRIIGYRFDPYNDFQMGDDFKRCMDYKNLKFSIENRVPPRT